jgi:hypothetical protein
VREVNATVSAFDTTSIDEREPLVIEIEEEMKPSGSDDFVTVASYFSIWDTNTIDPYGIDVKDFDDVVDLELLIKSKGVIGVPLPMHQIDLSVWYSLGSFARRCRRRPRNW